MRKLTNCVAVVLAIFMANDVQASDRWESTPRATRHTLVPEKGQDPGPYSGSSVSVPDVPIGNPISALSTKTSEELGEQYIRDVYRRRAAELENQRNLERSILVDPAMEAEKTALVDRQLEFFLLNNWK